MSTWYTLLLALFLVGCSDNSSPPTTTSEKMTHAKNKALQLCYGCHGPTGIGTSNINPNLAGQKKYYMIKQLKDYQSGERANYPPMTNVARMLSNQDIELISEWYSLQK